MSADQPGGGTEKPPLEKIRSKSADLITLDQVASSKDIFISISGLIGELSLYNIRIYFILNIAFSLMVRFRFIYNWLMWIITSSTVAIHFEWQNKF